MGFPLRQCLGGAGEVHGDKDGGGAAAARGKRGFWEGGERWQMPIFFVTTVTEVSPTFLQCAADLEIADQR